MTASTGEVSGMIEIDFVGSQQGNGTVSNSYSPRLRHAVIHYQGFTLGQTWSTLVNTSAFPETANLGGPLIGESMVRQALVRYSSNNWQFSLENPNTYGTDAKGKPLSKADDVVPDAVIRFNISGDWGNISVATLVRQLSASDSDQTLALGGSIAGKILVGRQDDLRFVLSHGNLGRYFATGGIQDIYRDQVETSSGGMMAYRHYWNDSLRSTLFYGRSLSDIQQVDRSHYGINLFTNFTPALVIGAELGRYRVDDGQPAWGLNDGSNYQGASDYLQLIMQYSF
ncbi:hypothetical protein KU855_16260 [Shewanella sp. NIFS-20-20]|nr:hypothetical protein [Shewanella sp. NIFS-20-20]